MTHIAALRPLTQFNAAHPVVVRESISVPVYLEPNDVCRFPGVTADLKRLSVLAPQYGPQECQSDCSHCFRMML